MSGEKTGLVIIGIGQELRRDDGAGIAAVRLWQSEYSQTAAHPLVQVVLLDTPGISLLDFLEGIQFAMIVDAVQSGRPPGEVFIVEESQLEAFMNATGFVHGFGVAETLNLGRSVEPEKLPKRLILLGIEASDLSLGQGLTGDVEAALPVATGYIQKIVCEFLDNSL